ncbi:N6-adenosine-methyltransferase MT-A70-like protein [Toxorhynchites rutilus septentrionalis]|uniref:N6-adenosine-methyltransferase MT-A70-like protein n=1 Tax=Toxorhynchites rutilus septentrionalis TaxID=329112 RepID=UPI002479FF22|nr:N6-adenosine-methyltransferase MT-A70-like protein [Toxorhynchites rutilus septentrionalis]
MSSWEEIQAVKVKRNTLRERLEKRKKERQDLLGGSSPGPSVVGLIKTESGAAGVDDKSKVLLTAIKLEQDTDSEVEKTLVKVLADRSLILPTNSSLIAQRVEKITLKPAPNESILYYLQKLSGQSLISLKEVSIGESVGYEIISAEHGNLQVLYEDLLLNSGREGIKRKAINHEHEPDSKMARLASASARDDSQKKTGESSALSDTSDIMSLLSLPSTREKQSKQVGEEILELLTKPTAKERSLAEKFKSQGGAQVMEFCPHGTRIECMRSLEAANDAHLKKEDDDDVIISDDNNGFEIIEIKKESDDEKGKYQCNKLHFKKIIQSHTDESLGDCSFLNTCFHMDTCKYVHYEVDTYIGQNTGSKFEVEGPLGSKRTIDPCATLYPPQWIQCDLRYLDMTVLGKFAVVMADPPWDIHMELPYGTMSDDEMRQLGVPALQDDGLIFLWVTGRAMELGRECLKLWGYERVDELIWVKTNQLQRIIRTGRTGHWLNHGKEHCLVGMKGNPPNLNRGLDCDVIVAEVRATSHKPDEIYGIIERLSPGTRKIELFGRPHNVQPNWITLGNQLDGIRLVDPELISSFQKRYPDGNCMTPGKNP